MNEGTAAAKETVAIDARLELESRPAPDLDTVKESLMPASMFDAAVRERFHERTAFGPIPIDREREFEDMNSSNTVDSRSIEHAFHGKCDQLSILITASIRAEFPGLMPPEVLRKFAHTFGWAPTRHYGLAARGESPQCRIEKRKVDNMPRVSVLVLRCR